MGFHEVRLSEKYAYGSAGGPSFDTGVITTASGHEERVSRWETPRRRYNISFANRTYDFVYDLVEFYIARLGVANAFRFKDVFDFTTAANGIDAPDDEDVIIGAGDAATKVFQLKKQYTSSTETRNRSLTKPVDGTVVVALDGVAQTETTHFTVDTTTGQITFVTAPGSAVEITAGCEFDVPVRFGEEIDLDGLLASADSHGSASLPNVPLIEERDPEPTQDEFWYGGAKNWGVITADQAITLLHGRVQAFEPNTTGHTIILPDAATMPPGAYHFFLTNDGTESVDIDNDAGSLVATLASGATAILFVTIDAGNNRVWLAK